MKQEDKAHVLRVLGTQPPTSANLRAREIVEQVAVPTGVRSELIEALSKTNLYYQHGKAIGLAKQAADMLAADAEKIDYLKSVCRQEAKAVDEDGQTINTLRAEIDDLKAQQVAVPSELKSLAGKGCGNCYPQDCQWPECSPRAKQLRAAPKPPQGDAITAPKIGEAWPGLAGIYAGLTRGEDGAPDAHLVMLNATPETELDWQGAMDWAASIGDGAHLPTRGESALLYANLKEQVPTGDAYWTSTQYSDNYAFTQYFLDGGQSHGDKKYEGRARAVVRIPVAQGGAK